MYRYLSEDSDDSDSEDSFVGRSLNCEMTSFAIPSTLEGHPSPRLSCTRCECDAFCLFVLYECLSSPLLRPTCAGAMIVRVAEGRFIGGKKNDACQMSKSKLGRNVS